MSRHNYKRQIELRTRYVGLFDDSVLGYAVKNAAVLQENLLIPGRKNESSCSPDPMPSAFINIKRYNCHNLLVTFAAIMVRILMLVLASDNAPCYVGFQTVWQKYMHTCPEIEAWFYKASLELPGTDDVVVDAATRTVTVRTAEKLEACHEKLVCVLRHFAPRFHEFDYLYRPNASTFSLLRRYVRHARAWPRANFYAGVIEEHFGIAFASGASFTLSMDLAAQYVAKADRVLSAELIARGISGCTDDVAVACIVGTPPQPLPRITIAPPEVAPESMRNLDVPWDIHNIRILTTDRMADVERHIVLYARFYAPATLDAVPRVTVVSACLYVDDATHTVADLVEGTREMLSANVYLVLFCSKALLPELVKHRAGKTHMTVFVCTELNELWTAAYHDTVVHNRERDWPTRDARAGVWSHLVTCNKFDWVSQVIQDNPFNTPVVAWADNKLSKMMPLGSGDSVAQLQRAVSALQTLDTFFIQVMGAVDPALLAPGAVAHYYAKYRHVVCGCLFALPVSHAWVLDALKKVFIATVEAGYGHGEEMLYPEVIARNPEVFSHSFGDYRDILTNCPTPRQNIPYVLNFIIRPLCAMGRRREAATVCDAVLRTLEAWQELPATTPMVHWQLYAEVLRERLVGPDGARDEAIAAKLASVARALEAESTFTFFEGLDFGGNNLARLHAPPEELAKHARATPDCIAFNSLGYLKGWQAGLDTLAAHCTPSTYFKPGDGIYVKSSVATAWLSDWLTVYERYAFITQVIIEGACNSRCPLANAATALPLLTKLKLAHASPTCVAVTGDGACICTLTTLLPASMNGTGIWIKRSTFETHPIVRATRRLRAIHASLSSFASGSLLEEIVEQYMSVLTIRPTDIVLEIGGNVGRNSCVIASLLLNPAQLLVLECDTNSAAKLATNSLSAKLPFRIEPVALSARRLEQNTWITRELTTDAAAPGWNEITTVTLHALRERHRDMQACTVLVADCEGALFNILQDTPEILDGIRAILIENDFIGPEAASQKATVHAQFCARGFYCSWQHDLCEKRQAFWQIWHRVVTL